MKNILIVKQIPLISTLGNVERTVRRICILMLGWKGLRSQTSYRWLSDLLPVSSLHTCPHQCLYATKPVNKLFVVGVVTCQVWQDTCRTCHNLNIIGWQQLHQHLQQVVKTILLGCSIWQIAQSPEAVLNKSIALVTKMHSQCLHTSSLWKN